LSRSALARGTEGFILRLRNSLFRHVQYLPFSWHTDNLTGDIIQRCTSDVETTRNFIEKQLIELIRTILLLLAAFLIMFTLDTVMALVCGIFVPIIVLYSVLFYRRAYKKFMACDEAEGDLMVKVQENLTGVRVVRAFGREAYEMDTFDEKNNIYAQKWLDMGYILGIFWGLGDVVSGLQLLAVVAVGALLVVRGRITLGTLLVFISYTQTIGGPVRQMGHLLSEMSRTGVALQRIQEVIQAEEESFDENGSQPSLNRDITFSHVTFAYDDRPVLEDVSFTVPAGSVFGILGGTGSGKSTLTYLLNRLYDLPENQGSITIGDVDIHSIDLPYLRRGVGLVLQEPFLFSKTIAENIGIAAEDQSPEAIRKAADLASIDEDIQSFPQGYDTMVGERGVTLSGGQKQRVAMARTLMLKSPIVVFDDSMSNLDMQTDARIRDALREGTGSSTLILVSHRISTLMNADRILVLDKGRVAQCGSHRELMAQDGIYRRVYDLQSGSSERREDHG
ncbi:MAG: ABC transporter ATP-binding protein/permease, partial [Oscillospiraceae bacterium]|nr:ABC transporter ATP-binding protein/permease [Oscillospiraceae bacterium]